MTYREFPNYFADAEASWSEAEYVIFGIGYDRTGSFRSGTLDGPAAIRRAAWNKEAFHIPTGLHLDACSIHDYGDLEVDNDTSPEAMVAAGYDLGQRLMRDGKVPILLGGEHNVPMGPVKAYAEAIPDLCIVQLDAHLDYRDEYEGTPYNHANALRRFVDAVGPERVAMIGFRSAEREEYQQAVDDGIQHMYTSFDVRARGMTQILDQVMTEFEGRPVYLTIDIDGFDPAYAPGTGTPEPFGLTDWDGLEAVKRVAPQLVGMDIVEVAPEYDTGQTAALAATLVREAIFWREHARNEGRLLTSASRIGSPPATS